MVLTLLRLGLFWRRPRRMDRESNTYGGVDSLPSKIVLQGIGYAMITILTCIPMTVSEPEFMIRYDV